MRVLAVMGGYRKGRSTDRLLDEALAGAAGAADVTVDKLILIDHDIRYCRNCLACRNDEAATPYAKCVLHDDMDAIYPMVADADAYLFATPVNMGAVTAVMKTFLERLCWTFAKPGRRPLPGCPTPRSSQPKRAAILVTSGLVPPLLRRFCDDATPLIGSICRDSLHAKVIGSLYAGALERRGHEAYLPAARELGRQLVGLRR